MIPIFQSCERWRIGACRNDLIKNTFYSQESDAFLISRPQNQNLDKMNTICKSCGFPLEIQRRECPVCQGYVIQNAEIPRIEIDTLRVYNYQCRECTRELFSYVLV